MILAETLAGTSSLRRSSKGQDAIEHRRSHPAKFDHRRLPKALCTAMAVPQLDQSLTLSQSGERPGESSA